MGRRPAVSRLVTFLFPLFLLFSLYTCLYLACPHCSCHPPSSPRLCPFQTFIPSSVCQSLDVSNSILLGSGILKRQTVSFHHHFRFPYLTHLSFLLLLSGDIHSNPGPTTILFAHLNTCSIASVTPTLDKPAVLQEFILDQGIEILALSETWLPPNSLPSTLNSLTPPNFSIITNPIPSGRGGSVAFIYCSYLKISKLPISTFPSFESLCIKLSIASTSYTFLTVYRPLASSISSFISDFTSLVDLLNSDPSELIISGDFNIHFDVPSAPATVALSDLLTCSHLQQHVNFPTHNRGHHLDLLISRTPSSIIDSVEWTIPFLSDHYAIQATLSVRTPSIPSRITKTFRSFCSIDTASFSNDILASNLYSSPPSNLNDYLTLFCSTLTSVLDKHAPLKTISFFPRIHKPFITPSIRAAKTVRSKLETIYRRTRSPSELLNFKNQSRALSKLITSSRRSYFRNLIQTCSNKPRQLWSALNILLSRKSPASLPYSSSDSSLASSFSSFFQDKISKLVLAFSPSLSQPSLTPTSGAPCKTPPSLSVFQPASSAEIQQAILSSSNSTCSLDIIPTFLLKACLPVLLQPITTIVNLSFSEGTFPQQFKHALVSPLLKKHNLPPNDFSSYRPISNLNFISKTIERIIHTRLTTHLSTFPSLSSFQSAYRKFHSTETALLRIQNDLLLSINRQKVSALVLLDLSAAFDTIDHNILLSRLSSHFGITGSALNLLTSYLTNRSMSVVINSTLSPSSSVNIGVPQGSVLGQLLFSLYTSPISSIFSNSPVSFHLYADDTQLYISFSASDSTHRLSILSSTLDSVHSWLTVNRLTVNPSKTEYLLIGTPQQRTKVMSSSINFHGTTLLPSSSARNLGVTLNSDLSYKEHISSICQTSFFHIRQLRQVRHLLDYNSSIALANALVTSRLDYCNSLLFGLPHSFLARLQRVQNALARAVLPSVKRFDHITPSLRKLHWLPICERIIFKIATLTFLTLTHCSPSYLHELLTPHSAARSLRSNYQKLLIVPRVDSVNGRRSFSFAAPSIWNSLPVAIRTTDSYLSFRSALKTHLFPP